MTDPAARRAITELFANQGWPAGGDALLQRSLEPRGPELLLEAPDLQEARRAAEAALVERSGDEARWSLGMLRPLTPMAPGTHRYRATFARWEDDDDRFVPSDRRP